ncbi:14413_t:CDS:2, partial [Funneliformis geosporum]
MEEFLLTREPLNIVRISTALFVQVKKSEWTGVLKKELENIEQRDIGQYISESTSYEKTMWERIEIELEEINVENLRFDHLICSGILDIKSESFTDIP